MSEHQNAIVCIYDLKSPRISVFQIHEWIYDQLHLPEHDVRMLQIDGPRRCVYIKFADCERTVLRSTNGQTEFRHDNGELSMVQIELAGMGTRRIRIVNLSLEIPDGVIRRAFAKYGELKDIKK
jgi:hypothetical protein